MEKNNENKIIKYLRSLILRTMLALVFFLAMAILAKTSPEYKDMIVKNVYETNISFAKIKNISEKYLGGIAPLDRVVEKEVMTFNEKITFSAASLYHDGVKLKVTNKYLVPIQKEGMVIYIGEKENYGNVIIVEGIDGVDIWYGNIEQTTVKLYDYVQAGSYLGTTVDDNLYLVYQKDGVFLDYKEYIDEN